MKRNVTNATNGATRLLSHLAGEKKKTVLAVGLIALMAFMWVRVLGRKTPAPADAASTARQGSSNGQSNSQIKISFVELPKVPGRNDVMTRDFFDPVGWHGFTRDREGRNLTGSEEVNGSTDTTAEVIKQIAQKLQLEAIVLGANPQAFINDKLLSVGDKLLVKDRTNTYECEVVEVEERAVFIRCREAQIKLELDRTSEVTN
jgi:hypothetical protein